MARLPPIFAKDKTAAQLMDMTEAEFLRLVDEGHLPKPRTIGGIQRWDVSELNRIARGESIQGGTMTW